MEKIIKYEDLYQPIKDEIEKCYQNKKASNKELQLEDAMKQWFREEFEEWMGNHTTKSDRRSNQDHSKITLNVAEDKIIAERRKEVHRRKNIRFNIELPVKVVETVQDAAADSSKNSEYIGMAANVSDGGLYFISEVPLKVLSSIQVILDFSKIDKKFENIVANAMVVKTVKLPNEKYGISIMFSKVEELDKANINYQILKSLAFQRSDFSTLFYF